MDKTPHEVPTYFQHSFKCMACGLHFIVCSDYEDWPNEGTTREQVLKEATGVVFCPECDNHSVFIHWRRKAEGFIFQAVPGEGAELIELRTGG